MEAIVLAGGLGTRLRSVVSEVPKCMAPVAGRPFLAYLLDALAAKERVDRVILSVGYLREQVIAWAEAHRAEYPFRLDFAVEEHPLGTGGGIRLALQACRSEEVLVLNGDTFFDFDPDRLAARDGAVVLALKPMTHFDRYGTVELDGLGSVTAFREKKACRAGLINAGVYLIRPSRLDLHGLPEKFSFEQDVLAPLAGSGKLAGVREDGYFIDIGIPSDYILAQLHWGPWETLLLDRDGLVNQLRPGDYVKSWDEFVFRPEFLKAIPEWTRRFRHIFLVTNQRGVGKGLMSREDLDDIHERMLRKICQVGGSIEAIYCCTATDEGDPRRKPQTGMWQEILRDHPDVRPETAVMVGDSDSDMQFARNAGIAGLKLNWT